MPAEARDIPAADWSPEGFTRSSDSSLILTAAGTGSHAVTVSLPPTELRALYLDAYSDNGGPLTYTVSVVTPRSSELSALAAGAVATGVSRSRSLLLWPAGTVTRIRLEFDLEPGQRLFLNRLTLNRKVPYAPDTLRIFLLLAAGTLLILLFRAPVFLRTAHPDDRAQRLITGAAGALIVIFCFWLTIASAASPFFDITQNSGDLYSRDLTDALLRGRFDLLTDPPPELAQLANPYDPAQRAQLPADNLLWDAAWFNGRYYVSYGVVPALLLFVPVRALSGYYCQTAWAVCLFGSFGLLFLYMNLRRLFLVYFPRLSFRWHFIAQLSVTAASFAAWGLARPKFYEVASLSGFFFLMLAAGQLIRAVHGRKGQPRRSMVREAILAAQSEPAADSADSADCDRAEMPESTAETGAVRDAASAADCDRDSAAPSNDVEKAVHRLAQKVVQSVLRDTAPSEQTRAVAGGRLFLTSLFLMLAVGCQPVQAIALLPYALVLFLLWRRARGKGAAAKGETAIVLFFSVLPLICVGALLGAYNWARFGSVFEFGSQYRLTLADFRAGAPNLARLLPALGQQLLIPPVIDARFPFIHFPNPFAFSPGTFFPTDGRTVGLLTLPLLAVLPLLPLLKRLRRAFCSASRQLKTLLVVSCATGLAVLAHDSLTLGVNARNAIDFGVWLALAAGLAWLMLADSVDNRPPFVFIHKTGARYPHFGENSGRMKTYRIEAERTADVLFARFLAIAAVTAVICALLFLQGENDRIRTYMPHVYEQLRRTLAFWLP